MGGVDNTAEELYASVDALVEALATIIMKWLRKITKYIGET